MNMVEKLDDILTSKNVVDNFYDAYNNNKEFRSWLDLNIPEVSQCERQKQNNPWHIYNVLGHILHSVEEMNKLTSQYSKKEQRMLSYVMFFHDIGKPKAHSSRVKNGFIIDSFFHHNEISKEIAGKYLNFLNFNDKEIDCMLELILKHDIFMFITLYPDNNKYHRVLTRELVELEISKLAKHGDGKKMMEMLIKIGRADSGAQNPFMTKSSFELLDKFEEINNKINKAKVRV